MKTFKIIGVILSLAIIAGLGFCVVWTVTNFEKVQQAISGSNIYNKTDIDNAYSDGYNTALENEKEYLKLIEGYRDTITELRDTVAQLNSQVSSLTTSNTNLDSTIQSLQTQHTALQTQVNELKATNSSNTVLIESLNAQINSLSQSIATMTEQASNNAKTISTLSNKITALESTTAHYEELLMQYESADKATVKFMLNNKVYNMQVVNKNSKVNVVTPNVENIIFNGWTLDGTNIVDLSTITITQNTTFVASITLQYDVVFKVDNVTYNTQKIITGDYATLPTAPSKENHNFVGWSLDGTNVINPTIYEISQNTIFVAKFEISQFDFLYNNSLLLNNGKRLFSSESNYVVLYNNRNFTKIETPTKITTANSLYLNNDNVLFTENGNSGSKKFYFFNGESFKLVESPIMINIFFGISLGDGKALFPTQTGISNKEWVLWNGNNFVNISSPIAITGNSLYQINLENGKVLFSSLDRGNVTTKDWALWNGTEFIHKQSPIGITTETSKNLSLGNGQALFGTTTSSSSKNWVLFNGNDFVQVISPIALPLLSSKISLKNGTAIIGASSLIGRDFVIWNGTEFIQGTSSLDISFSNWDYLDTNKILFSTVLLSDRTVNYVVWNGNVFVEVKSPTAIGHLSSTYQKISVGLGEGNILFSAKNVDVSDEWILWNSQNFIKITTPETSIFNWLSLGNGQALIKHSSNAVVNNNEFLLWNGTEFVEL